MAADLDMDKFNAVCHVLNHMTGEFARLGVSQSDQARMLLEWNIALLVELGGTINVARLLLDVADTLAEHHRQGQDEGTASPASVH